MVVVINLVSGSTREGQVLKTLLNKLETIRGQLNSDKVFDVVGRLFEGVSVKDYLEQALEDLDGAVRRLNGALTEGQVRAIQERERSLFGEGGDVKRNLPILNQIAEQEPYRRLLPGYVRRFVEKSALLLSLRIEGELDEDFRLVPTAPRALDPLLPALETYSLAARDRISVYQQYDCPERIWIHPGEPLFDRMSAAVLDRFSSDALNGSVFGDPHSQKAYLFHIARISVRQSWTEQDADASGTDGSNGRPHDFRLVGIRQSEDGTLEECPVEHLLLLKGVKNFALGTEPLAAMAGRLVLEAKQFATEVVAEEMVRSCRREIQQALPERLDFLRRGFDFQTAELAAERNLFYERVRNGDDSAAERLASIRNMQRRLVETRRRDLAAIEAEPNCIRADKVEFLIHALVVPAVYPEAVESYDADVETIATDVATMYERDHAAEVRDVSRPELARRAGLPDWPGFDLLSKRPRNTDGDDPERAIEVKGRRGYGGVELTDNEWAKACNLRDRYWLYVVFDCATSSPRLLRIRDPFGKLLVNSHESTTYTISPSAILSAAES